MKCFRPVIAKRLRRASPGRSAVGVARKENYMQTQPKPTAVPPFRVNVPEEGLADMPRRITATRWPEKETVADQSQGVPLAMIRELARYWATDYDWRKCEATLNVLPQ